VTLLQHLEELRRRIGISLAVVAVFSCVSFGFVGSLIEWLKRPAGSLLPRLAFFSPTEALVASIKVSVVAGTILSLPLLLYEVWAFVRPALKEPERWYGVLLIWWGTALFVLGAAMAYGLLLPVCLRFLLGFGGPSLEPVISINRYLGFVLSIILVCGILFQLPLVTFVMTRLGVVTPQRLRRSRRVALLIMVIVAAVATPTTDALNMLLMAVPMALLYELSIGIAAWSSR